MNKPAIRMTRIGLAGLLGAVVTAGAIERPKGQDTEKKKVPDLPAQPQGGILEKPERLPQEDRKQVQKVAFLGVGGVVASEALMHQLELENGLLLTQVAPNSPAGLVGLAKHDILVSLDEMPLTDQDSLRKALANFKPGDEVSLKLVRRGDEIDQKVVLGESQALPRAQALIPDQARNLNDLLRGQLGEQLGGFGDEQLRKQLLQQLERAFGPNGGNGIREFKLELNGDDLLNGNDPQLGFKGFGSMRLEDAEGSIEMKNSNGQQELTILDPDGKLLFSGPYDTDIDKEAVPEEYRERVERLLGTQGNGGFQLKIAPPAREKKDE